MSGAYVILLCAVVCMSSAETNPLVTLIHGGQLQGLSTTLNNVPVDLFLGVRYAKPPLGELRFRKPEPLTWKGNADATHVGNPCMQCRVPELVEVTGVEDCLYLDISVPWGVQTRSLKPVMVWIHGGAYVTGTGISFPGGALATHGDVIVVTINYRLGVMGFLSDGPGTGNYGLWDQRAAIVWVKENIAQFGGDAELITIFGNSAGGGSVSSQMMSPHNGGLFQRGIQESGSLFQHWGWELSENSNTEVLQRLRRDHCKPGTDTDVHTCLRQVPAQEIFQSVGFQALLDHPFTPTADSDFFAEDISINSYKPTQRFDVMSGMNGQEGLLSYAFDVMTFADSNNKNIEDGLDEEFVNDFLKHLCANQITPLSPHLCVDFLTNLYKLDKSANDKDRTLRLVDFLGDHFFNADIVFGLSEHSNSSKSTYAYYLTELIARGPDQYLWPIPEWGAKTMADHVDEIFFVFGAPFITHGDNPVWREYIAEVAAKDPHGMIKFYAGGSDKNKEFSQVVMTMWTNFAKSGNPNMPAVLPEGTPAWPQFTNESNEFLKLNSDGVQVVTTPNRKRLDRLRNYLYADRELQCQNSKATYDKQQSASTHDEL